MAGNPREALGDWLIQEWSAHFGQSIESMTGERPESSFERAPSLPSDSSGGPSDGETFWWEQPFSYPDGAMAWVGAPATSWKEIGERVLKSAGVDDGDAESIKSTYQELVNQSLSGLAQSLTNRLRREVACGAGREAAPAAPSAVYSLRLRFSGEEFPLFAALSAKMAEAIQAFEGTKAEAGRPDAGKADSAKSAPPKPEARRAAEPAPLPVLGTGPTKSLDLLLDVELPIGVSFGRAELPLKEVIKLTTGSIVELNRSVSEPVEIIVNNCVIARGQVVVVEGNFGVRIQQVISRQERLRTLK